MNNGIRHSFNLFFFGFLVIIGYPTIARLHLRFMSDDPSSKQFSLITSCLMIVPANVGMVPMCFLFNRCMDLHKRLSNLLAHTVHVDLIYQSLMGSYDSRVYDPDNVSLLRRDLDHPDQLKRLFAPKCFGISLTYTLLCKIHFWFGFILLSIIAGNKCNNRSSMADIFC